MPPHLQTVHGRIHSLPISPELRLEQSVRLLDSTDQSISEIGENCGFRSPSYYIEAFRQQFHCTPFQYRKKTDLTLTLLLLFPCFLPCSDR